MHFLHTAFAICKMLPPNNNLESEPIRIPISQVISKVSLSDLPIATQHWGSLSSLPQAQPNEWLVSCL